MDVRVCEEVSCGCSTPECYKVSKHEDLFIFTNEDTNRKYSMSKDIFLSGIKTKSLEINRQKLSQNAIVKLEKMFGGV